MHFSIDKINKIIKNTQYKWFFNLVYFSKLDLKWLEKFYPKSYLPLVHSIQWWLFIVEDFLLLSTKSKSLSFLFYPHKNRIFPNLESIKMQVNLTFYPLKNKLLLFMPKESIFDDQNLSNKFFIIIIFLICSVK